MSKIEKVCSTCKHEPRDENCLGCTFDWKNSNGNTHWESEELDFSSPKKVVGNLISVDVLDKIRAEIESKREEVSNKNSENNELQAFFHGLNDGLKDARDIIDRYKAESEE